MCKRLGISKIIYFGILFFLLIFIQMIFVTVSSKADEAGHVYEINGKQIAYDDVEWPGEGGCWTYTNQMYEKIWDVQMSEYFEGFEDFDLNLLRGLNDEERLFTADNAEIFIKYAKPGALIRIFDAVSSDPTFDKDGAQMTGTYGHSIIIAAIYDEGFVAFESLSDGTREMFYTWEDFYLTWSSNDHEGKSRYKYFKYIKWPDAPTLVLAGESEMEQTDMDVFYATMTEADSLDNSISGNKNTNWVLFYILIGVSLVVFVGGLFLSGCLRRKKEIKSEELSSLPLKIIFIAGFFLLGGFFAWNCALMIAGLLVLLLFCYYKRGNIQFILDERMVIGLALALGYGLTSFWSIDKGMAPYGFIKSLVVFMFVVLLQQYEDISKELIKLLPWIGTAMTVLSFGLSFIPQLKELLTVNDRLAGFFQYPNVYALFLLTGLIVLAFEEKHDWVQLILAIILLAGILLSGSRITFALTILTGFVTILLITKGKTRGILLVIGCVAIITILALAFLWKNGPIGRFIQIAAGSSEVYGRLLYMRDVLPVILKNPFGLGYMGYYYSQGSFQTGVYAVMSVHNGLLQLLIDIGWVPAVLIAIVLVRQIWNKQMKWSERLILLVVLAHSMLDFDLDFMAIWFIIILCMKKQGVLKNKLFEKRFGLLTLIPLIIISSAFLINLGLANFFESNSSEALTLSVYPNDTYAMINKLIKSDSAEESKFLGEKIIELDNHIAIGHDALANDYYSQGKIEQMIEEKEKAIANARYSNYEYIDYFDKLAAARDLYISQDSIDSAEYCKEKLNEIPEIMNSVLEQSSPLAYKITNKPNLSLSSEQKLYLNSIN